MGGHLLAIIAQPRRAQAFSAGALASVDRRRADGRRFLGSVNRHSAKLSIYLYNYSEFISQGRVRRSLDPGKFWLTTSWAFPPLDLDPRHADGGRIIARGHLLPPATACATDPRRQTGAERFGVNRPHGAPPRSPISPSRERCMRAAARRLLCATCPPTYRSAAASGFTRTAWAAGACRENASCCWKRARAGRRRGLRGSELPGWRAGACLTEGLSLGGWRAHRAFPVGLSRRASSRQNGWRHWRQPVGLTAGLRRAWAGDYTRASTEITAKPATADAGAQTAPCRRRSDPAPGGR